MRRRNEHRSAALPLLMGVAASLFSPIAAADLPDLESNPASGYVESVDTATESNNRVQHIEDEGQGERGTSTLISTGSASNPRIAINLGGDSWVVWWQDASTDAVYYTVRDLSTGAWSDEDQISETGTGSRNPEIVHDGSAAYVAFEADDSGDTSVVVAIIVDDPEPVPSLHDITSTSWTGDVDVDVHSETGHVWATWVDSSTEVGWAEWDSSTEAWSLTEYETYDNSTVKAAREEIRDTVLGL